jgi:putative peptidoglycan lipid II flippase
VNAQGIARAAGVVAAFGVLSRVLGFVREAVLSRTFGTQGLGGAQADVFANSLFLVNTVAALLLYSLVTLIIPVFEQEREERDEASAWGLLWAVGAWVVVGLCALGALAAAWPQGPTALFHLDHQRAALMEHLVRIMSAGLALQGISALLTAVLQSQRRFVGPAVVGVAFNLGVILGLVIGGRSVEAAAWGMVAGAAAQVLFQLPQLIAVLRHAPGRPAWRHPRLRGFGTLALPVLAASLAQQINGFTDKLFASSLDFGRTAALNYANAAGSAPRTVLLMPLLAPVFPVISRMFAEGRHRETAVAFNRAAGVLGLVSVPVSAFLMIFPAEVARLMFGGSKCGAACVTDIAGPLRWYALAVWAAFIGYLLNRSLSAANRAREIMWATLITVAATIGLDLILIRPLGHSGLALATALGVMLNTAITTWMLARALPDFSPRLMLERQGRLIACGAIASGIAIAVGFLGPGGHLSVGTVTGVLLVKALIAGVAYVAATRVLAAPELREGANAMRAIVRRARPA